jgi:hypothetical protein
MRLSQKKKRALQKLSTGQPCVRTSTAKAVVGGAAKPAASKKCCRRITPVTVVAMFSTKRQLLSR